MRSSRFAKILLFVILIGPIAIFLFGQVVMFLWNNTLVPVFNIKEITFWQGLGILVLSKILFSSFGGKGGSDRYYRKQRMMWDQMTPEQREKFKEEWRSRRWGRKSWRSGDRSGEEAAGQP